jgi:hypothetical protein
MLRSRRQILSGLGAGFAAAFAAPAFAGIPDPRKTLTETPILLALVAAGMHTRLDGLRIRLHNYRSNGGRGGHEANASSIRFATGETQTFDIPTVENGAHRYYLNEINLERVLVRALPGRGIRLALSFEGNGTEIKSHCRGTIFQCPVGSDDSAPDVQIQHAKVEVVFAPRPFEGGLTLVPSDIDFTAEIRAGGICGGPDICNAFGHYRVHIRRAMQSHFGRHLRAVEMQRSIANAMRPALDLMRIGFVHKAAVRGTNIVVVHSPRA